MRAAPIPFARSLAATALATALLVTPASALAQAQQPGTPVVPPGTSADKTAPVLTKVTLTPRVARAAAGRALRFQLSEAARVTGEVLLHKAGVRTPGGRCLQRTSRRSGRDCVRRVRVGRLLATSAASGSNRAQLDVGDLVPGGYTLVLTARDDAGNVGPAKRVTFRVRR